VSFDRVPGPVIDRPGPQVALAIRNERSISKSAKDEGTLLAVPRPPRRDIPEKARRLGAATRGDRPGPAFSV
jgi:hypothetical protein